MTVITYNAKLLFNSKDDKIKMEKLSNAYIKTFNECSKVRYTQMSKNNIKILHNIFYKNFRNQNPIIPSQLVIRAEKECLSSYQKMKTMNRQIKKPILKKKFSLQLDKRLYSNKGEEFKITSLSFHSQIKCKIKNYTKLKYLISKYKFGDPSLFQKNNEFYISLPFKIDDISTSSSKIATGVDLGIRNFAATSEGKLYKDKKFNSQKRKIRFLKRKLQSKFKNSNSAIKKFKKNKI